MTIPASQLRVRTASQMSSTVYIYGYPRTAHLCAEVVMAGAARSPKRCSKPAVTRRGAEASAEEDA